MIKNILKDAYNEKSLIGIRTRSLEWGELIIGFVIELEHSYFTINEIDEFGLFIGKTTLLIEDIVNIVAQDRYQRRLELVHKNNSTLYPNERVTIWKEGVDLLPYFEPVVKNEKIITLFFNEEDYVIGRLRNYDKDYLIINNIGVDGDEDGISCYHLSRLIGLRYGSLDEQKIELLYKNRTSFY